MRGRQQIGRETRRRQINRRRTQTRNSEEHRRTSPNLPPKRPQIRPRVTVYKTKTQSQTTTQRPNGYYRLAIDYYSLPHYTSKNKHNTAQHRIENYYQERLCDQRSQSTKMRHIQIRRHVRLQPRHLSWQGQLVRSHLVRLRRKKQVVVSVISNHSRRDNAQDLGRYGVLSESGHSAKILVANKHHHVPRSQQHNSWYTSVGFVSGSTSSIRRK